MAWGEVNGLHIRAFWHGSFFKTIETNTGDSVVFFPLLFLAFQNFNVNLITVNMPANGWQNPFQSECTTTQVRIPFRPNTFTKFMMVIKWLLHVSVCTFTFTRERCVFCVLFCHLVTLVLRFLWCLLVETRIDVMLNLPISSALPEPKITAFWLKVTMICLEHSMFMINSILIYF